MKTITRFFLQDIGFALGIVIVLSFATLLLLLNLLVIERSENAFINVLSEIQFEQNGRLFRIQVPAEAGERWNILRYDFEGNERREPLQEVFTSEFQQSLLWIGLIGVFASFFIGFLAAFVFTRPLSKLVDGLRQLRDNDYKVKLQHIGTDEYDEVITEFNHLTEELQRVEELRKDLISETSHELKTPLASLVGQIEGIRDGLIIPDENRMSQLLTQTSRLQDLIEQLQEFTRLRNKHFTLEKCPISLAELVHNVQPLFQKRLDAQKITVTVDDTSTKPVEADTRLMERVLSNFFENTLRYADASAIRITITDTSFIFTDNGQGVSAEHVSYLFERFYRVEKSRNRKTGGLGLGLSIVKEIIDAHNWTISVEQANPGLQLIIKL